MAAHLGCQLVLLVVAEGPEAEVALHAVFAQQQRCGKVPGVAASERRESISIRCGVEAEMTGCAGFHPGS